MFHLPTTANLNRCIVNTRTVDEEEQLTVDEIIGEGETANHHNPIIEPPRLAEGAAGN